MAAATKSTTFLHLSDIHFRPQGAYDADGHLRTQIENDVPVLRKAHGPITGILVTGDIAYSGSAEEFRRAGDWLDKLCAIAGCRPDRVWMTPGNHDVNRAFVRGRKDVSDFHERVRTRGVAHVDTELNGALGQVLGQSMLESIQAYNDFAARYGCDVTPASPYWQQDILLNDGSTLKMWGLTSTLISNEHDDLPTGRLVVVGSCQLDLPNQRGVETMSLCHHPPRWLIDEDNVDTKLLAGARVQLFGHKHSQSIRRIDDSVRIIAGAVHPSRHEREWTPRYNAISFEVRKKGKDRSLKVSAHMRIWNVDRQKFVADTISAPGGSREEPIPLGAWSGKAPRGADIVANDKERQLAYRFHSMDHAARCAVLEKIGIAQPSGAPADLQFFQRSIQSLKKSKRLSALWKAINTEEEDDQANPFDVRGEK